MSKKTIVITSVLAIVLCAAVIVGTTLAVFTSDTTVNISFVAGKVKLDATVSQVTLYSAQADKHGNLVDEKGNKYSYSKCSGNKFVNGGTADFADDGTLSLSGISAGDKVQFRVDLQNESTIPVVYKMVLSLLNIERSALFDALEMTVATPDGDPIAVATPDSQTKQSDEVKLPVDKSDAVVVTVALPIDAVNVQNISIDMRCTAFAVQDTTAVTGVAIVERDGQISQFYNLRDALRDIYENETLYLMRGAEGSVGDLTIDKSINIVSYNEDVLSFTDLRATIANENVKVSISGMEFKGNSYINVSNGNQVSLSGCVINATPSKVYDAATMQYLDNSGFIVSTKNQLLGVKLQLTDNTFVIPEGASDDYTPVYLASPLADGSVIKNNVFGSAEKPLSGFAVVASANNGALLTIEGNTFYGGAVALQGVTGGQYSAVSASNKLVGGSKLISVLGAGAAIDIYDTGSTINGAAIGLAQLDLANNTRFGGINVAFVESALGGIKVREGLFQLCGDYTEQQFVENYMLSQSGTNVTFVK